MQVWELLVQRAKLVAARDWRQSWSAMTYQKVWLRRLLRWPSSKRLLPLCAFRLLCANVTCQASMGVAVFGGGEAEGPTERQERRKRHFFAPKIRRRP